MPKVAKKKRQKSVPAAPASVDRHLGRRVVVYYTHEDYELGSQLAKQLGISLSELLREALAERVRRG